MQTFAVSCVLAMVGGGLLLADAFGYSLQTDEEQPVDPRVQAVEAAEEALQLVDGYRQAGLADPQASYQWSRRLAESKLRLTTDQTQRLEIIEQHVGRTKTLLDQAQVRLEVGIATKGPLEVAEVKFFLAEARLMLQEEQKRAESEP